MNLVYDLTKYGVFIRSVPGPLAHKFATKKLFVRKLFWLQLITDSDLAANVAAIAASVQQKRSNIYVTYLRE